MDLLRNLGELTGTNSNPYCQEACFESNDPLRISFKNALRSLTKGDIILFGYTDRLANIGGAPETRFKLSNKDNNDYYFEHIIGKFESYDENGITLTEAKTNYDRTWKSSHIGDTPKFEFYNDIEIKPYYYDRIIKKTIYVKKSGINQKMILENDKFSFEPLNDTDIIKEQSNYHHIIQDGKDNEVIYEKDVKNIFDSYPLSKPNGEVSVDSSDTQQPDAQQQPVAQSPSVAQQQPVTNEAPSNDSNPIKILNSEAFATSYEDSFEPKLQVLNNTMLDINGNNYELNRISTAIVNANRLTRLYMLGYNIVEGIISNEDINKTINGKKLFPFEVKPTDNKGKQIIQNGKEYKLNASQNAAIIRLCMLYSKTNFSNNQNEAFFNKTKTTVLSAFENSLKPQLKQHYSNATLFDPSDLLIHSRIKKRSGVVNLLVKTNEVDYIFLKDGVFFVKDFVGGQYQERVPRREYIPFIENGKLDFKLIQTHINPNEKTIYNNIVKAWNNTGVYFGSKPIPEDSSMTRTMNTIRKIGSELKTGVGSLTNYRKNGMKGGKPTRKRNKKHNKRTRKYYI